MGEELDHDHVLHRSDRPGPLMTNEGYSKDEVLTLLCLSLSLSLSFLSPASLSLETTTRQSINLSGAASMSTILSNPLQRRVKNERSSTAFPPPLVASWIGASPSLISLSSSILSVVFNVEVMVWKGMKGKESER
jgi:hypothetical protein